MGEDVRRRLCTKDIIYHKSTLLSLMMVVPVSVDEKAGDGVTLHLWHGRHSCLEREAWRWTRPSGWKQPAGSSVSQSTNHQLWIIVIIAFICAFSFVVRLVHL